ncbi:MAG: putative membrane protein, partial [Candidatus Nomurabacteria bacterium GW2011_GWB1_43_19]
MLKKILFVLLVISIFLPAQNVLAQDLAADPINIYFFWGEGCPHCEKEKPFLETLEEKYP